jgi:hypothetical protein
MIGFESLTALTTAWTAATRDTPQDAEAPDAAKSTSTEAASIVRMRLRSILPIVALLLLAGCGGSSRPAATRIPRIEQAVKSTLERGLMTSQPRTEQGSRWSTHVRRIRCAKTGGNAYSCEVTFGDGSQRRVTAHERSDGNVVVG